MQEILSREVVSQIRQLGGEKLLNELAELYLEHTPKRLESLGVGVRRGNREQVAKAAHSIRSSSLSLGAAQVAENAAAIERLANAGSSEDLDQLAARLEEAAAAVMGHLASELGRGQA
jgi:HPt (histidine-containing phosphotransfer) domain-containing protein